MKKLTAVILFLVFMLGLAGCSNDKATVWNWAHEISQEDLSSAGIWSIEEDDYEYELLDDAEVLELVALLNSLTKNSFTENKNLVGITPLVGIKIEDGSETYNINYSPSPYGKYGMLEIKYEEKQWWIDSPELLAYFLQVIDGKPTA